MIRREKRSGIKIKSCDKIKHDILSVTKGSGTESVDLTDLRLRIKRLRQNSDVEIKKLSGKLKEDYEVLKSHVGLLYDTEEYKILFEEVKKVFSNLKDLKPNTIGAYCAGCLENKGKCTVICNGAMPMPKTENGWEFCNYPVVWAIFQNGNYKFSSMNKNGGTNCVIYMESAETYGFSLEEKKSLKELGFVNAQLFHAPLDGKEYKIISKDFVSIDSLPVRTKNSVPFRVPSPPKSPTGPVVAPTGVKSPLGQSGPSTSIVVPPPSVPPTIPAHPSASLGTVPVAMTPAQQIAQKEEQKKMAENILFNKNVVASQVKQDVKYSVMKNMTSSYMFWLVVIVFILAIIFLFGKRRV